MSSSQQALSSPHTTEVASESRGNNGSNPPSNPRLEAIAAKHARLESQLAELQAQRTAVVTAMNPNMPADWTDEQCVQQALKTANAVKQKHINSLNRYNEVKDIGQGLIGMVAEKRGVRVVEVMREYEMGEKD